MFSPFSWIARLGSLSAPRMVALISFFGQLYFFVPVMTPYLQGKGLTLAQVAGMQTMLMATTLAMEIPTGVLADRIGHRRSYQIAMVLAMLGELATLLAESYPQFLIGQVIAGTGFAFASGSVDAYVYESLPVDNRTQRMQQAKGMIGTALQLAALVAYSVGGFITRELTMERMRLTLKMDVIFVGIGALLAFALREPVREIAVERLRSGDLLRVGVRTLRENAVLSRLVLIALVTNPFAAHLLIFYQAWFIQVHVPAMWLGLGLALGSVVAFFTQLHAWRLPVWFGERAAILLATGLPGIGYLLMAITKQPALAVVVFVLQWGVVQMAAPLFAGMYNEHIEESARATSLSLISGILNVWVGIGGVLLGWLGEWSLSGMFALVGGIVVLGAGTIRPLVAVERS